MHLKNPDITITFRLCHIEILLSKKNLMYVKLFKIIHCIHHEEEKEEIV